MAHWGQGPAGPPPLGPEGFDWTAWHPDPTVVIGLAALAGLYLTALQRGRHDDRRVPPAKVVSFFGGLLTLYCMVRFMLEYHRPAAGGHH